MPTASEGVLTDLRAVRATFELRWNEQGAVTTPGYIDPDGHVKPPIYDGRWELWDTDPYGNEYRVMTLNEVDGSYCPPDQRLVERMRMLDPERWDGNIEAMLEALVDRPQLLQEAGTERDQDDLIDRAVKWHEWRNFPKERVVKSLDEMAAEAVEADLRKLGVQPKLITPAEASSKGQESPCLATS